MANRLMECSPSGVRLAVDQGQIKGLAQKVQLYLAHLISGLLSLPDVFWDLSTTALFPDPQEQHLNMTIL